jgi:hypothetical protein
LFTVGAAFEPREKQTSAICYFFYRPVESTNGLYGFVLTRNVTMQVARGKSTQHH